MLLDYEFSKSLQDERDYKFTKDYAYDYQENQIGGILNTVINRNAGDDTINFIEDTRAFNINYLSNQITIAQNTPAPIKAPIFDVGGLSRSVGDYLYKGGSGNFGNPHNVAQVRRFNIWTKNTEIYKNALNEWAGIVAGYVNNLTRIKNNLESYSFI
jgi:hypothetical protein